jgi:hypothetical protein
MIILVFFHNYFRGVNGKQPLFCYCPKGDVAPGPPGGCHSEGRRFPRGFSDITYLKGLDAFNRCNPGNASFVSLDKGEAFWQQAHD